MQLPSLEQLQSVIVEVARREILPRFNQVRAEAKADGSVVTAADHGAQRGIIEALARLAPSIPLLGEEMTKAEQQRLLGEADYLWCLDPLDGTSNFVAGLPFFCTSLALVQRGLPLLAIVYDPVRDECFCAERGRGASLNGQPLRAPRKAAGLLDAIAEVDLKRLQPALAARVACEPPFRSQRNFGSGALDWAWLAAGRYQLYLHGGQNLWDYAAGNLILAEAGGVATTLEGEALVCDRLQPRSVVAAVDAELHALWSAWTGARAGPANSVNSS